ncbi:MAG: HAMP domain-containing histidine kinase, partial [Negativicutes bacterium]|nr:HAMP domain-containing histidine kinase [Negativicutes bacterium]
ELVTPLNHINGYISMVLEGLYEDEAERDSYLNTALSGANELLTIVRNVVDLCAVEGQKLAVSKTPVNLRALVDEVCGQFAARAGQKQLKLTVEDRLDGNEVWTSADTLKKILAQLLDNAVKFTDQGQITVRLRTDGEGRPVIAVEDSGIGIAEGTDTAKLFDKFQQGDIGLNKEYGGAGLGLTVAGAFAGLIGAELALHSPGRGRGTVATIRL